MPLFTTQYHQYRERRSSFLSDNDTDLGSLLSDDTDFPARNECRLSIMDEVRPCLAFSKILTCIDQPSDDQPPNNQSLGTFSSAVDRLMAAVAQDTECMVSSEVESGLSTSEKSLSNPSIELPIASRISSPRSGRICLDMTEEAEEEHLFESDDELYRSETGSEVSLSCAEADSIDRHYCFLCGEQRHRTGACMRPPLFVV